MRVELLLAKDCGETWEICGITYLNAPSFGPDTCALKASKLALIAATNAIEHGKRVFVSKSYEHPEVLPTDLVIEQLDPLSTKKRIALNDVDALMHQNILGVSVTEAFEYLQAYMDLLASGIFINDSNREEKYFEIIEAAQEKLCPDPLPPEASFDEEQEYQRKLKEHQDAKTNFERLEKYLNSLDRIQKISGVNQILQTAKTSIESAQNESEVDAAISKYKKVLDTQYYTPYGRSNEPLEAGNL